MTKKKIIKACIDIKDFFGLQNWDIAYVWLKKDDKKIRELQLVPKGGTPVAFVESTPKYQCATIYFNEDDLAKITIWTIVHEFIHIVHSPFREYVGEKCHINDNWEMFSHLEENFTVNLEFIIGRALFNSKFKKLILEAQRVK